MPVELGCDQLLRTTGYKNRVGGPVYVGGVFGPATAYSVRNFQADNGLIVDGKVGPKTWSALAEFCRSPAPARTRHGVSPDFLRQAPRFLYAPG